MKLTNLKPGVCRDCGFDVPAGVGRVDLIDGVWLPRHDFDGGCARAAEIAAETSGPVRAWWRDRSAA